MSGILEEVKPVWLDWGKGMRDELETRKGKKGQIKRPHVNFVKYVIV